MSDGECRGQRTIIWNVERESADAEMREIESSCAGSAVSLFPSPRLPRRQSSPLSRDYSSRASASEANPFPPPPLLILHSSRFTSFFTRLPLPAFTLSQSAPNPLPPIASTRHARNASESTTYSYKYSLLYLQHIWIYQNLKYTPSRLIQIDFRRQEALE